MAQLRWQKTADGSETLTMAHIRWQRQRTSTFASKFRFSYLLFIAVLSPSGTLRRLSLRMIMNRQSLTLVHMTQTVAFTVMIMGNPKQAAVLAVVVTVAKGYDLGYI